MIFKASDMVTTFIRAVHRLNMGWGNHPLPAVQNYILTVSCRYHNLYRHIIFYIAECYFNMVSRIFLIFLTKERGDNTLNNNNKNAFLANWLLDLV